MVRDFNLIRTVLFQVEKALSSEPLMSLTTDDTIGEAAIGEHLAIMIEAGLIEGDVYSYEPLGFLIHRLTWKGHDFLENSRNDTIWKKVIADASAKGSSVSMTVLYGLRSKAAEKYAGLE